MLKKGEKHFVGQINQKALIRKDGKILLIQYPMRDKKVGGRWDMPGGRLNLGEKALEGLKREVLEEIGMEINVEKILITGTFTNLAGALNYFVIYQASLVDENKPFKLEVLDGEVAAVSWFPEKDFPTVLYPEYQEALKSILV